MNAAVQGAATAYLAPKIMNRFRWHWLLYGAAAYYGLKLMSKRGIFPNQANAALDMIDGGIDTLKEAVGLKTDEPMAARSRSSKSESLHH